MALLDQSFFHYSLLAYYLLGPPTFIALRFFQFPYGKHNRLGWGPTIPPPLAWFIMESPSILLPLILFPFGQHFTNPKALVLITSHQNTTTTIGFPLILTFNGFLTQALNTYIQARWVSHYKSDYDSDGGLFWWKFFGGLVREGGGYKVPRGGWFELVTCPNYFGEIVEWLGWAVMTWSWAGFGFFLYTCSNLVPRACANHKWYLQKFAEDYPKNRKAVIPFFV
ncbi:steroid 5-alpha-reductase DET2-like [Populus alba x Populus x berolinensis]|nr:steroid 5-alpha-reductase DET2-like [Populus alba x Populus x berolinensis]